MWSFGLVHTVVLVQECRHVVKYVHCMWRKPRGLVYPIFLAQKKSGWDVVSKTMKYVTAMTCRLDLGWWKSPCGVLGHLCQTECANLEV